MSHVDGSVLDASLVESDFATIRSRLHTPFTASDFVSLQFITAAHIRAPSPVTTNGLAEGRYLDIRFLSGYMAAHRTDGDKHGYQFATNQLTNQGFTSHKLGNIWTPIANTCHSFECFRAMNFEFLWGLDTENGPDYTSIDAETKIVSNVDRRLAIVPFIGNISLINPRGAQISSLNTGNFNFAEPYGPAQAYALTGYQSLNGRIFGSASSGLIVVGLASSTTIDRCAFRHMHTALNTYTL